MKTVLGIDLGTQSLRVLFYDYGSRAVAAQGASPLEVDRDHTGRAEQRSDWWLTALQSALRQVPDEVRRSVQAIGVSGQQHGFVPVDAHGKVVAPVKLWCDTATRREADEIMDACGGRDKCIHYAGNPVLTGYTAPKVRWLAKNHPDRYRAMTRILLPHDYLNFVMTGVAAMEYGDASGTAFLDVRKRQWSPALLSCVDPARDLSACLPPLIGPDGILGTTSAGFAEQFGLPPGVPVAPGGGDNMMAAIGTGNVVAGKLTMSLGTSGTLFAHSDVPIVDPQGNIAAFCSSTGGWLPLLCTMNCTQATELVRRPLGISTPQFDGAIGAVIAGSDGLVVLPFFSGERTPNLPAATASISGMNAHNCTAGHLLRATVEGVTYGLRFGVDELRRLGLEATDIVLTGGGARSAEWRQIVADICELPVTVPEQDEGASFGAALQALWVLERHNNGKTSIAEITGEHVRLRPDAGRTPHPGNVERYARGYSAYRRMIEALAPTFES